MTDPTREPALTPEEKRLRDLACEIASDLFRNGLGSVADRLVLVQGDPPRDLGGWSIGPAVDVIFRRLKGAAFLAPCLAVFLSACSLIPQRAPRISQRDYCREASRQGWCSPSCGKRQPALCHPLRLLSCSDWMCTWEAGDGSLVFSADFGRRP